MTVIPMSSALQIMHSYGYYNPISQLAPQKEAAAMLLLLFYLSSNFFYFDWNWATIASCFYFINVRLFSSFSFKIDSAAIPSMLFSYISLCEEESTAPAYPLKSFVLVLVSMSPSFFASISSLPMLFRAEFPRNTVTWASIFIFSIQPLSTCISKKSYFVNPPLQLYASP